MSSSRPHMQYPYWLVTTTLSLWWVGLVSYSEHGTFRHHASRLCTWPVLDSVDDPTHVLVVADPQILDRRSYPGRAAWLVHLSAFVVDMNLRKSWTALMRLRPHVVIFLGDMMDNGRTDMPDEEYEAYFRRFRWAFHTEDRTPLPTYFIPGNHDTGLGLSSEFSSAAVERYTSHFGPLQQTIALGNHTLIMVDAPGLVTEEAERLRSGLTYEQWATTKPSGPIAFLDELPPSVHNAPTVLFTHIPLARPEGVDCGPLRERGTIRVGAGFGYQNTLGREVSQFVLRKTRPALILSGDDHDYCEYEHVYTVGTHAAAAREVTVKSLSMAMGVHEPGFELLTLGARTEGSAPALAVAACSLPDQLRIYTHRYLPLLLFTLFALLVSNLHRVRTHGRYYATAPLCCGDRDRDGGGVRESSLPPPGSAPGKPRRREASPCCACNPPRGRRPRQRPAVEVLWDALAKSTSCGDARRARLGLGRGIVRDLLDTAWMPALVFLGLTWWVF